MQASLPKLRGRKPKASKVVLFNSSGRPQLREALQHYAAAASNHVADGQSAAPIAAIVLQEHKQRGQAWQDEVHNASKLGWTLRGAEAHVGDVAGERSKCGVAVAVRAHIGVAKARGSPYDCSPSGSPGRVAAIWVDGILRGGMMIISVYLWHTEGLTSRNWSILHSAVEAAKRFGGPFIIAGDFNMAPECLAAQHAFLKKAGLALRAANSVTCTGASGGTEVDMCLIDARIQDAIVRMEVDSSFAGSPHQAVVLTLRASAPCSMKRVLRKPKGFPTKKPTSAPRPDDPKPVRELQEVLEQFEDLNGVGRLTDQQKVDLDNMYASIVRLGEAKLCSIFDCIRDDGSDDPAYVGRGLHVATKEVKVIPPQARAEGATGLSARGLSYIAVKLKDLAGAIKGKQRVEAAGRSPGEKQVQHFMAVRAVVRKPTGDLKKFLSATKGAEGAEAQMWRSRLQLAGQLEMHEAFAVPGLLRWSSQAANKARAIAGDERRAAHQSFCKWVDEQLRTGASGLHKLSKRQIVEDPVPVTIEDGSSSLAAQAQVEKAAVDWSKIWLKFASSARAPWRTFDKWEDLGWAGQLPSLEVEELRQVAKTYNEYTGRGCEGIHPRWISWMTDEWLQLLCDFLKLLEFGGYWPSQLLSLVCLIPKADGGRRPIGLLPAIVRIWERARRPIVQSWRLTVERSYNWAAKGRSPEDAVWHQALRGEIAKADGLHGASALVDLVKAFEMVKLQLVWRAGLRLHFHPVLLRMIMEVFALARRLVLDQAVSDPIVTLSAVLAGGTFATDALFMLLIGPCDEILIEHPGIELCTFVDDLTISCVGTVDEVASKLPEAFSHLVSILEDELDLTVSKGTRRWVLDPKTKTVATANSKEMRRRLDPYFRSEGVPMVKSTKLLGIDYSAGGRIVRKHWQKRADGVMARQHRYCRMGQAAAKRLVRTGAAPALRYGAGVYGSTKKAITAARSFACNALGKMAGRCGIARLTLAKYDPGAELALKPILDWARACWERWVPRTDMAKAWRGAMTGVGLATKPFGEVTGPAGAFVASAHRVGWKVPSPSAILTKQGTILDLDTVCPLQLLKHAQRDLGELEALSSSTAARIGGAPDFEPLKNFLDSKLGRRMPGSASLRALGEGGWWTQERLWNEGVAGVTDPFCRACVLPGDGNDGQPTRAVGSFIHRTTSCAATRAVRDAFKDAEILGIAQRHGHRDMCFELLPLYQHGIPMLPERYQPPGEIVRICGGRRAPDDFSFTGHGFTDGAMRNAMPTAARRAGWASILVDDEGKIIFGLYGPCECHFPTALRAELHAVLVMLRHALPPLTIHVDCKTVVDGWRKGRSWCVSASRPDADLWAQIWRIKEDIGPGVEVVKCKGHATESDVLNGVCTRFEKDSNDHADHYAGAGVDIAVDLAPNEKLVQQYKEARRWYLWLATLAADLPTDTQQRQQVPATPRAEKPPIRLIRHGTMPHTITDGSGELRCEVCQLYVSAHASPACRRAFLGSKCRGSMVASALANGADGKSHRLYKSGDVVWCFNCGYYSTKRAHNLVKRSCPGHPRRGSAGPLGRLKAGVHPKYPDTMLPRAIRLPQTGLCKPYPGG